MATDRTPELALTHGGPGKLRAIGRSLDIHKETGAWKREQREQLNAAVPAINSRKDNSWLPDSRSALSSSGIFIFPLDGVAFSV